jgi:hypothetical protein
VLFDAGDTGHPLSFNVLACNGADQRSLVASGILGGFKKAYSDSWGPRLEHIFRNALLTLLEECHADSGHESVGRARERPSGLLPVTLVAFQVGAKDAESVAEQLGPELAPQDLLRLPRYHAYARLLINGMPSRPFSMSTLPPRVNRTDPDRPAIIRRYCRQRYARPVGQVEAEIRKAFLAP